MVTFGRLAPRAEQDKERDNSCAILGEQDKTKDAGGAAPQVITNAALFMIGPTGSGYPLSGRSPRAVQCTMWAPPYRESNFIL